MSQPATDQVSCPACRGGNPPQARNCMWCGALLALVAAPAFAPPPVVATRTTSRPLPAWFWIITLGLLGVLALFALVPALETFGRASGSGKPPDYIKQISAYREGTKAFEVYFILADKDGLETTADGSAMIRFTAKNLNGVEETLYSQSVVVKKSDFQHAKLGKGAFEHDGIILSFGRIPYSSFDKQPDTTTGSVVVTFSTSGRTLEGTESVFFDR